MRRDEPRNMRSTRIRAFPQSVDNNFVDGIWTMLKTALNEILNKNNSGLSFEELYRNAYTLVLHKRGDKLYHGLQTVVNEHLRDKISPKVEESIKNNFLDTLKKLWEDHTTAMIMIRDILMYMDRVYVTQSHLEPVYNLGLRLFREQIIDHQSINAYLRDMLLNMIALERAGETIAWNDLKSAIQMLITLGFENRHYYEEQFEVHFLNESHDYYQKLSEEFLETNSAPVYVRKVNECLEDEKQRAERYLDKTTENKILLVVKNELIKKHLKTIVEMSGSGMVPMLDGQKIHDLRNLYELGKLIPEGIEVMTSHMSAYLRERGKKLVEAKGANPLQLIQDLLELKDQFDVFLDQSFLNDKEFKKTIQNDFTYFFNIKSKNAEYLAIYVDDKLKKGRKNLSESEIELFLDKAMVLFKFLADKDVFERYYKQHLAKRLLFDRSVSDDIEKAMISKLKTECGCQFTGKLYRMLADVSMKSETSSEFRVSPLSRDCIETTAMVLTTVVWPMTATTTFEVASELQFAMNKFTEFYQNLHSGRRLAFLLPNCRGEIVANCFAKRYTFVATAAQISILTMFNSLKSYSFEQIQEQLKMKPETAVMALQAIVKTELLIVTQGLVEDGNAVLALNDEFQNKKFKVDLTKLTGKSEMRKENEQVQREIEDDRRHVVQAAIVRIMKTRKLLKHSQLVAEVLGLLASRFNPKIPLIKKSIDILIEREYLKREKNDHETIEYIA